MCDFGSLRSGFQSGFPSEKSQRKRDDNKNKIWRFSGGGVGRGAERKIVQNAIFHGKRHDNKILKVKILLSRNFVVMAQAPKKKWHWQIPARNLQNCPEFVMDAIKTLPVVTRCLGLSLYRPPSSQKFNDPKSDSKVSVSRPK